MELKVLHLIGTFTITSITVDKNYYLGRHY